MRLARKFVSVLLACFFLAFASYSVLRFRWAIQTFEEGLHTDHHLMGLALGAAYAGAWKNGGEKEASAMLRSANQQEEVIRVRWLPLDSAERSDPGSPLPAPVREAVGRGEETSLELLDPDGQKRLFTWVPLTVDESRKGALELSESLLALRRYEKRTGEAAAVTAGGLALLCALMTILLGIRWIGVPMAALAEKARRVGAGDLSGPITLRQSDEISDLANELNRMCERLREARDAATAEAADKIAAVEQLRHASRLATVGRLASGLAHEMGTPLNVVSARAKMIASGEVTGPEAAEDSRIIAQQAEKMTRLIRQVMDIARGPSPNPEKATVDVTAVVRQTLEVLKPLAEKQGISLTASDLRSELVEASGPQVEQALTNLVINGIQASPAGTTIRIGLARERIHPPPEHGGPEGEFLRLSVRDEGSGMSAEVQKHLFEPFFTTKGIGKGTGLGLSVSGGLIREQGGWIAAQSELGHGSCFSIFLPGGTTHA